MKSHVWSESVVAFQTKLASLFEFLVCEITKLIETSFDFHLEVSPNKKGRLNPKPSDRADRVETMESLNSPSVIQDSYQTTARELGRGDAGAVDLCEVGEGSHFQQQHCKEEWSSSLRQHTQHSAFESNGNGQHRSEQSVEELSGLGSVHMAEPGPEHVTQRHIPAGSEHSRETINNQYPENFAENVDEIGSIIKVEHTEVELSELDTFNVSKQHTDPQTVHMKHRYSDLRLHGPLIGTYHFDTHDILLNCVTHKTETELQSIKDENTDTELDSSHLEQDRQDLGSRGQQQEPKIPLQKEMRPCLVRVERLSLQHRNETFSTCNPVIVTRNTAEFTGNPVGCNYCAQCGKDFRTAWHLKIHQRIHTGERPYFCDQCGKSFRWSDTLKSHQKIHTGERPYSCDQCGKSFIIAGHLKVHYRIHTGEKPYKCGQCGKSFIKSSLLKSHLRIHTGEKPYSCVQCGKSFNQSAHLYSHQKIHTGERPHSCDQCGKGFISLDHMKVHYRIHTGEKPYNCGQCGKCFINSSLLKSHLRIHTGEKPYTCAQCGKSFNQSAHLNSHQRIHTGERPYSCDQCGKGFITSGNLKAHYRIHTGEKPYNCSQCEKSFLSSSLLNKHLRIHTGERPYCCAQCGKRFRHSGNLTIHQTIHTRETYSCVQKCSVVS
ncbi:zinc finger protein 34 isoform X1 [Amia ocellicauda]|uniref:zinc finger protein 34 isoform X1 n=1 Tax=Amia ocellicauda TaxID=2972642 RepID=UPI0034645EBE